MSRQRALQATTAPAQQPDGHRHRTYTVAQLLSVDCLNMPRRTFFRLRSKGELPFLEELRPRLGRVVRYRADLVDRYLAGQWGQSRSFGSHVRQSVAPRTSTVMTEKVSRVLNSSLL